MLLETLLTPGQKHEITHVFVRHHITFFKIGNESFCTAAGHVYHSSNPMFESAAMKVFAAQAHDEQVRKEHEEMYKIIEAEDETWEKHKAKLYVIMANAILKIAAVETDKELIEYVDNFFEIYPTDAVRELLRRHNPDNELEL